MRRPFHPRGLILLACPTSLAFAAAAGMYLTFQEPDPNRGSTLEMARFLLARGDSQGAERILRELSGAEPRFLLGKLLAERGEWAEAQSALMDSLPCASRRMEALRLLTQGSMKSGDWEMARLHLRELERADSRDPAIPKALAICHRNLNNPLAALAAVHRALALSPEDRELIELMSELAEASARFNPQAGTNAREPQPLTYRRRNR